jgi:hypothetical protein
MWTAIKFGIIMHDRQPLQIRRTPLRESSDSGSYLSNQGLGESLILKARRVPNPVRKHKSASTPSFTVILFLTYKSSNFQGSMSKSSRMRLTRFVNGRGIGKAGAELGCSSQRRVPRGLRRWWLHIRAASWSLDIGGIRCFALDRKLKPICQTVEWGSANDITAICLKALSPKDLVTLFSLFLCCLHREYGPIGKASPSSPHHQSHPLLHSIFRLVMSVTQPQRAAACACHLPALRSASSGQIPKPAKINGYNTPQPEPGADISCRRNPPPPRACAMQRRRGAVALGPGFSPHSKVKKVWKMDAAQQYDTARLTA